jgi:hypothetical protein
MPAAFGVVSRDGSSIGEADTIDWVVEIVKSPAHPLLTGLTRSRKCVIFFNSDPLFFVSSKRVCL